MKCYQTVRKTEEEQTVRERITLLFLKKVKVKWSRYKTYFTGEVTLRVAHIVTTEQLQHYVPYKHGLFQVYNFNPLTPNDHYSGRTAPLTSKRFILYIYSTNTCTEYFKHGIYCPFFLFKMQFVS